MAGPKTLTVEVEAEDGTRDSCRILFFIMREIND
jgi:hypothetical protein